MKLGGVDVTAVKLGASDIVKIALGSEQVWPSGSGPTPVPFWAVESMSGVGQANIASQGGNIYRVGDDSLAVNALRAYGTGNLDNRIETVRLWRVLDESLLAEETMPSAHADWSNVVVFSPAIVLNAGEDYVVTMQQKDGNTRPVYRNPSTVTYYSGVSRVGAAFVDGTGYPTEASTHNYSACAFGYVEPA